MVKKSLCQAHNLVVKTSLCQGQNLVMKTSLCQGQNLVMKTSLCQGQNLVMKTSLSGTKSCDEDIANVRDRILWSRHRYVRDRIS